MAELDGDAGSTLTGLEIAVIGMSARFPGAANIDEFWKNLKNGVESLRFYTAEELAEAGLASELLEDPSFVKAGGGLLQGVEYFDAGFFDYTPNEALVMHPQVRLFHECAWEALENAGYDPCSYQGKIGLYAGASPSFKWQILVTLAGKSDEIGQFASASLANSDFLATRLAYKLNLKGPCFMVQSACSTSLAAIDLACRAILTGQCGMALAGGVSVSISLTSQKGYFYKEGMIRSPDGHCRAFDAQARGTIAGEGVGVVVLKLLEDALQDGDTIQAVIKGTATNNDGSRKVGYTAPSIDGQAEVIRAAHMMAEIDPESVTYVEAHGTGTPLGDPVEIEALKQGFGTDKRGYCRIGSVKANMGHLDAAAGVASFIKTVLALRHRQIPPSLHVKIPNPKIDFENSPFLVNTELSVWDGCSVPLRAGVSSFGIGGTNVHVILEEWPDNYTSAARSMAHGVRHSGVQHAASSIEARDESYQLILLSAKTESALDKMTKNLAEYLKNNPGLNLPDAAYTLQVGRKAFRFRRMLLCSNSSVDEVIEELSLPGSGKVLSFSAKEEPLPVVFMFPGQGSQYVNMGLELYESEPLFREEMDRCLEILKPLMGCDLREIIYPDSAPFGDNIRDNPGGPHQENVGTRPAVSSKLDTGCWPQVIDINQTEIAQPLLFAIELALAKLLMKWGIKPYAMVGHSIGEYVAAHLAGVFSLEQALKIVALRGKLMGQMPSGSMLSVSIPGEGLKSLLVRNSQLSLAAENSPFNCTVSGPHGAIEDFERQLKDNGIKYRRLHTSHAFHSAMMEPIVKTFAEKVGQIALNKPEIPYLSNLTGSWITAGEATDPGYWAKHLRRTVRFSKGVNELLKKKDSIFVELGPGRVLTIFVKDHSIENPEYLYLNLMRHPREEVSDVYLLYQEIGRMWLYGKNVDWQTFHEGEPRYRKYRKYRVPLPTYPFERQRYWIEESSLVLEPGQLMKSASSRGIDMDRDRIQENLADWFYLPNWKRAVCCMNTRTSHVPSVKRRKKWLVFLDKCGLGAILVKRLQDQGYEVVCATPGPGFAQLEHGQYTVNSRLPEDYQRLFNSLDLQAGEEEKPSLQVLHLWTITGACPHPVDHAVREWFEQSQTSGFYSLLIIARALRNLALDSSQHVYLNLVTDHLHDVSGQEELDPLKSTMLGPLAVIPQEHPNIFCRSIDIVFPAPGSWHQEILVEQLLAELAVERGLENIWDTVVAFRGPHRLVQSFDPLHLQEVNIELLPLREKGVYFITGGLGKIGLMLAEYLAREFNARLILTGRSSPPSRQADGVVQELESLGGEVLVFGCDAADEDQMQRVIAEAEQRWGVINGVIHAAGIVGGPSFKLVEELEIADCEEQFRPKVYGTLVLEKLFRGKTLDFCCLISSLATVLGGLQFSSYAAANAFMDAFVCRLKRQGKAPWFSLDWDGLAKQKTVEAFKRILTLCHTNGSIGRLVVSRGGNLQQRIDRWIKLVSVEPDTVSPSRQDETAVLPPRPQLFTPYAAPSTEVQKSIAEVWKKIFGYELIGSRDNFLELGGDSLKAVAVISAIHKHLHVEIPLRVFFSNPTIEKLAEYIEGTEVSQYASITLIEKKEYYPLSSSQKRLYFLQQMDLSSTSYNMPLVYPLGKNIQKDMLESTLKKLTLRHESLRSSFHMIEEEPFQRILEDVDFAIEYFDMEHGERNREVNSIIKNFVRPFDFTRSPLLRSGLIKLPDGNYVWLLDIHHIVSDGTSHTILAEDFLTLYNEGILEPLRLQYKDFSQWQNGLFASGKIKSQEDYWLRLYSGELPRLDLVVDYKRPEVFTFAGDCCGFTLGTENAILFKALGAAHGGTLYMNILAALNTLFYKYTRQTDIIIGSGIAGRPHADLQRIVGMFVNTLAMRNYPDGDKTYETFLEEVIAGSIEAFENQDVQFEELVDRLELDRDPSRNPLFDISMVVQNFRQPGKIPVKDESSGQIEILPKAPTADGHLPAISYRSPTSKFDMTFFIRESGEDIHITIEYYTGIFKLATIKNLVSHFKNVIKTVNKKPSIKLKDIDIISDEERRQILYEFSDTAVEYPGTKTIQQLFEEQVERTPDRIAAAAPCDLYPAPCSPLSAITYRELDEKSSQLANYLYYKKGLKAEESVGILMSQSLYRPIAILGVLKASGCYVPIDPSLPLERVKYMITDANIGTVISQKEYLRTLNRLQWECESFHSFLCMNSSDVLSEEEIEKNELMDEELWEHVGKTAADDITGGGWISSYTGEPLSREEMDEYGDNILKKLAPLLNPRMRVLEIGCASGISMFRIAPKVGLYYGTDLSAVIIDKNREIVAQKACQNIKLSCLAAHEIHQIGENNFDLIIMNSVIQCFHGHNYLRKILRQCIDLLGEKGYLFIGDIMDQEKKGALVRELMEFKRKPRNTSYTTKTDFSAELFVSRRFWEDMMAEYAEIEAVEFSDKIFTMENELTKFRYDALITINKRSPLNRPAEKRKHQDDGRSLLSFGPERVPVPVFSHNLAYIIYTSGTTGMPKGVTIEHGSLVNLCYWHIRNYDITEFDHATLYAGFGFDASVWELFPYLLKGSTLLIVDDSIKLDIEMLSGYFQRCHITISFLPTQLCEQFMFLDNTNRFLRVLLTGGDKLHTFVKRAYNLYNNYGPTENAVVTTSYPVEAFSDNISIGKPIDNTCVYILDKESLYLQPVGVPGELCISGAGLARGYLNQPELTAERFINDKPQMTGPSVGAERRRGKMYRTGDLARWLPDGNIEFLGRIDQQVKIRGFRIELEEIESQLMKRDDIGEAVVLVGENETGDKYLCAYVVPYATDSIDSIDPGQFREYLSEALPDYMIPAHFVLLEKFPLTPNGKVDRKALPEPGLKVAEGYAAPRDRIEEKLTEIWSEILGVKRDVIGIDDNFFDLGGHSLRATILTAKVHKEMNFKLPLVELFKTPTIRGLGKYIKGAREDRYASIPPAEKKEYYVLSPAQKRLFILQQMDSANVSYNMPQFIPLARDIDRQRLASALGEMIARHESLRTSFHMQKDKPVQRIHDEVEFKIQYYDTDIRQQASDIIKNFILPFDLANAPLLRVGLIHQSTPCFGHTSGEGTSGSKYLLMVDMHHIITDGTSQGVLENEIMSLNAGQELPSLKLQYKDYAEWQDNKVQQEAVRAQEKYWLEEYAREIPVLNLPVDFPRPVVQSFEGSSIGFSLTEDETRSLYDLSLKKDVTLYMVLLSIFYLLLSKLSGQEDIVAGTVVAGRRHADLQAVIGMFVNTLALRNHPCRDRLFSRFLKEVKERTLKAFENQEYPFEELVERVEVSKDVSRNPLFDVMFVWQNMADLVSGYQDGYIIASEKGEKIKYENQVSKFDLTLTGLEIDNRLIFSFQYCTRLFKGETIKRFIVYFRKLVTTVQQNPEIKISDIEIITAEEKMQILYEFNDTKSGYPKDKTIHELFEEQVGRIPDQIALLEQGAGFFALCARCCALTYQELNQRSNRLACLLQSKGVKPGAIAAVMVERSVEMVIGLLGILKAGGAYLPIDPQYPAERISYMLTDSAATILLLDSGIGTEPSLLPTVSFKGWAGETVHITTEVAGVVKIVSTATLAYVMYTSGSTGRPKGVLVEHMNVLRLVINTCYVELTRETRILQTGAPVFDATTFEIWGALLNGGQLVLVEKEIILEANQLGQAVEKYKINTLWLSSPLFNQLTRENSEIFSNLNYLLVGGDVLSPRYINLVRNKGKKLKVINGYGPTENTTFSTTFLIERDFDVNIPIGSPISNSTAYILNKDGLLQPIGVYGELWVGGDGVARGYLNSPELTAEKFLQTEHANLAVGFPAFEKRLYRTGDVTRWLSEGNIEFSGRMDFQVKIRGFRIEFAEIENQLLTHNEIKDVVVTARENQADGGEPRCLCAYVVSDKEFEPSELREYLSHNLPDFMIPSYFVRLDKLPLNPNGKLDRKALPEPEITPAEDYVAPRNKIEEKLVEIWSEVLGRHESISTHDNFFDLGGHSLKATTMVSKILKELNVRVPLVEIFKAPTVREIAAWIARAKKVEFLNIEKLVEQDFYELSYHQKRLWVLNQLEPESSAFHMPDILVLHGKVDEEAIKKTFFKIFQRHESLRTGFKVREEEPVQFIIGLKEDDLPFKTVDISTLAEKGRPRERNRIFTRLAAEPFQLDRPPLFRSLLVKLGPQHYELMFNMHHIITDGWSIEILKRDFSRIYDGYCKGENVELPHLEVQYKDFAAWHNQRLKDPLFKEKSHSFWTGRLQGGIPTLKFRGSLKDRLYDRKGAAYRCAINGELKERLTTEAAKNGTSLFMVMFSAYILFLHRFTGQEDIACSIISAGRDHVSWHNVMGFFVNSIIFQIRVDDGESFKDLLQRVNLEVLELFEYQSYPLELVFEDLNMRYPALPASFNMVNLQDTTSALELTYSHSRHLKETQEVKFDLEPYIAEYKNGILMYWAYRRSLLTPSITEYMATEYIKMLDYFSENLHRNYKDYRDQEHQEEFTFTKN